MSKNSLRTPRWLALVPKIKERDGYRCVQCGSEERLSVDHITPIAVMNEDQLADGMQYDPDNLQTLCITCNGRKADKVLTRKQWIDSKWFDVGTNHTN